MEKTFTPQQSYKNRAEAYRLFIQAQGLPIGQTKFYNDCDRLKLINLDKKIDLASLMAYVRQELNVQPSTGQMLVQQDQNREKEDLELRKLRAETEKKERENEDAARELDRRWLHRDVAEEQIAGLIGALEDALDHHIYAGAAELIHKAGGDPARLEEVIEHQKNQKDLALGEVLVEDRIEAVFKNSEEDDE